ncbi:HNH endonuclease [Paracoccus sp. 11-3]|uniref:HNH endonuclease n=1 Tax=Paracoccus amoyensis TaxID=2760093 RepID=A0A926JD06_9RHOB|nr:HNH endonuclease [Paracoccus amoyensis]
MQKECIYCGDTKSEDQFSDEHIWPDALGGDYLPKDVWRTKVCRSCNSMAGLFVDAAFIRSWIGKAEQSTAALDYLAGLNKPAALPLSYMGHLDGAWSSNTIADHWLGPCSATIIHLRPSDNDQDWSRAYAGGDPKNNRKKPGRAYLALTSEEPFWVVVSLLSFAKHFKHAEKFVVNLVVEDTESELGDSKAHPLVQLLKKLKIRPGKPTPSESMDDFSIVNDVLEAARRGEQIKTNVTISQFADHRLLAKIALGLGFQLFGGDFTITCYAKNLRKAFREANVSKRLQLPLRGQGYFSGNPDAMLKQVLPWSGGWLLLLRVAKGQLGLHIVTPTAKTMTILICDEPTLVSRLGPEYEDGQIWLTIPPADMSVGPIPLPDYIAHQLNVSPHPELVALGSKRGDWRSLPQCRASEK